MEVEARAGSDGERVCVAVRDEGSGIAEENINRIFEPFFTTSGGSGLGLPVSQRIVEEQGGNLWAENQPEGGSVPEKSAEENVEKAAKEPGEN